MIQLLPEYLKSCISVKDDSCWVWTGRVHVNGHGIIYLPKTETRKRRDWWVHRVVYEHLIRKLPSDIILHHKCKVKLCVNPEHLEETTNIDHPDNITKIQRDQKFCKRGHLLEGNNLKIKYDARLIQHRVCRRCSKVNMRAWRSKRAQKA